MVDIFDEVDEELRAERTQEFLKKYGGLLLAGCLLIVGAVGGWKAWGWYQEKQDIEAATRYLAAASRTEAAGIAGPNRPEAIAAFEAVAASAPDGYRVLARLRLAALKAESGDLSGASALWDLVAADGSADPLLRDLASLTWCLAHADKGDPAVVEGRLKPLASPGNPYRSLAQEQLALLDLRQGRADAAKAQLKKLSEDISAPGGVRGKRRVAGPGGRMSDMTGGKPQRGLAQRSATVLSRRATLLAPLALAGCETIEGWFSTRKDPLPGKREPLTALRRGFNPDESAPRVSLPPAVRAMAWPQANGTPTHLMGHLSAGDTLSQAWAADLGEGGGYRRKILARPVVADGVVFAMDSEAKITALALNTGARLWRTATVKDDVDSTNVGGGLCWDAGTLFAVNGMSELLALDPAKGTVRWRHNIDVSARSAPTVAEGRIFLTTIDGKLLALSVDDGRLLWSYQATQTATTVLGGPAPAYAQGVVVAEFASGEVAALRAETGTVIWTDGLGISHGKSALADFLAIRGEPVISNGQVYVTGLGGLTIAADLLTGRRVWERRVASGNTPWLAGSWMFVVSTEQEAGAINADDARVSWVAALPRWENPEKKRDVITWYGPVLAGGRLIVVGSNHKALWLNPATGETVQTQSLSDAPAPFAPVVVDGTLLVVTDDGRLTAWR